MPDITKEIAAIASMPVYEMAGYLRRLDTGKNPRTGLHLAGNPDDPIQSSFTTHLRAFNEGDMHLAVSIPTLQPEDAQTLTTSQQLEHFGHATFMQDIATLDVALRKLAINPAGALDHKEKQALGNYKTLLEGLKRNQEGWLKMLRASGRSTDLLTQLKVAHGQSRVEAESAVIGSNADDMMRAQNTIAVIDQCAAPLLESLCRKLGIQVKPLSGIAQ